MRRAKLALLIIALVLLAGCSRMIGEAGLPAGVLYQDDLDADNGNWLLESDLEASAGYAGGKLQLSVAAPNLIAWAELKEHKFGDFVLQVDATQLAGPDNNSYGVVFRMKNPSAYYIFDISGDGYYRFWRREDAEGGRWVEITPEWLESAAIHTGASTNQIKIVAQGSHFTFYVNEQLVAEADDSAYGSGLIGLDAGSFDEPGVLVAFDNLKISKP